MTHLFYDYRPVDNKRYVIGSTMAAIIAGVAVAGSIGTSIYATQSAKSAAKKAMPTLPEPTKIEDIKAQSETAAKAASKKKQQAIARSSTIFTSPLGLSGEAATAKKTLLGL